MKLIFQTLKRHMPWLLLLLGVDGFSVMLLWLGDFRALRTLSGLILLGSLTLFGMVLLVLCFQERQRARLFSEFLTNPDAEREEALLHRLSRQEGQSIALLASVLREQQRACGEMREALSDYEIYVEAWAHEAKTPLSLLTMLLDNRGDEIPPPLRFKLDYVRSQLQEDITQMLYYARLKSTTKDYLFERVELYGCIEEVLEEFGPMLEENRFTVRNETGGRLVYTDRRGLSFMLGQIISNAVKYHSEAPSLTFSVRQLEDRDVLSVADNGIGVRPWDLPYLFQKGFTGDSKDSRKKATGMGLYLTRKMAEDLNLAIEAESQWHEGFTLSISFPRVTQGDGAR